MQTEPTTPLPFPDTPRRVVLRLNQQQMELLDRTLARGIASSRVELVRLALREQAALHGIEGEAR